MEAKRLGLAKRFYIAQSKKKKKGGKRKAEATKLLMLLSFIGTILPSEEKDELKVDEERKKIFKIIMEGWPDQIASLVSLRDSFIMQWKNKSLSSKALGILMWHVCCLRVVCRTCKRAIKLLCCSKLQGGGNRVLSMLPCMHRTMPASKGIEGKRQC